MSARGGLWGQRAYGRGAPASPPPSCAGPRTLERRGRQVHAGAAVAAVLQCRQERVWVWVGGWVSGGVQGRRSAATVVLLCCCCCAAGCLSASSDKARAPRAHKGRGGLGTRSAAAGWGVGEGRSRFWCTTPPGQRARTRSRRRRRRSRRRRRIAWSRIGGRWSRCTRLKGPRCAAAPALTAVCVHVRERVGVGWARCHRLGAHAASKCHPPGSNPSPLMPVGRQRTMHARTHLGVGGGAGKVGAGACARGGGGMWAGGVRCAALIGRRAGPGCKCISQAQRNSARTLAPRNLPPRPPPKHPPPPTPSVA